MSKPAVVKPRKWYHAPPWLRPFSSWALYALLRMWATIIECFPVDANLFTARCIGRIWWTISPPHRRKTVLHLARAYRGQYPRSELLRIGRESFEHWTQVFLVELVMCPRLLNRWSWSKYVELRDLGPALIELLRGGAVMITPHFGNFELLGFTLCRLGVPLTAVMRPLDNERLNDWLVRTRAASGLRLLYKQGATEEAESIVTSGTPLCFIADQDAGPKGYFVRFFNRPASTYKSIALLAIRHRTPVICGYAARTRKGFHYRFAVERVIRPEEWESRDDAPLWLTQEFSTAMESSIRKFPEQYLWVHRRWKNQPKKRMANSELRIAN